MVQTDLLIQQLNIDYSKSAAERGMRQAEHHANQINKEWTEKAYSFLKDYISHNQKFMVEDVRFASQGIVPCPPTQRAWGSIIVRAAKAGLIIQSGYDKTKNVNAHRTPAAVWMTAKHNIKDFS